MNSTEIYFVRLIVSPALLGIIFLLVTMVVRKLPTKSINQMYGYRTKGSMTNNETWKEANEYSLTLLKRFGKFAIALGIILSLVIKSVLVIGTVSVVVTIVISILVIILTEKRLNSIFDNNGQRKNT